MSLNTTAVRIKVTLKDVKPEVMRRLVVPVTLRLDRLHLTLQAAFGWTNSPERFDPNVVDRKALEAAVNALSGIWKPRRQKLRSK
jgi:hypothetical protein